MLGGPLDGILGMFVRTGPDIESMEVYSNILKLRSKEKAPAVDKYRCGSITLA